MPADSAHNNVGIFCLPLTCVDRCARIAIECLFSYVASNGVGLL